MFRGSRHSILKRAIKFALKKPAPSRSPLSGEERVKNDCFVIELRSLTGEIFDIQVDKLTAEGFSGRQMEQNEHGVKVYSLITEMSFKDFKKIEFKAYHFYTGFRFDYTSPTKFLIVNFLKAFLLEIIFEKAKQSLFEITTKERTDRIDVLKFMIGIRETETGDNILNLRRPHHLSAFELFKMLYGDRIFGNQQYKQMLFRFEMILQSFVHSEEISEVDNSFQAEPKALETISRFLEENRRHKEQMSHNRWVLLLTIVVTITACIQAYSVFVK